MNEEEEKEVQQVINDIKQYLDKEKDWLQEQINKAEVSKRAMELVMDEIAKNPKYIAFEEKMNQMKLFLEIG